MKFLASYRAPLFIAGLFALGFLLVFIGLFVEDPKPELPDFMRRRQPVLDERPEPPDLRE